LAEESEGGGFWESVQEIGQLNVSETTTIKFEKGITKRGKREVNSTRSWVKTQKYSGPTKAGFALDPKTAKEFYNLLGKN
jgi:hypothetical protein